MVAAFRIWSGSCCVHFFQSKLNLTTIDYYKLCDIFGSLQEYIVCAFYNNSIVFIALWDIVHPAFSQLLPYMELRCDGVETQSVSQVR